MSREIFISEQIRLSILKDSKTLSKQAISRKYNLSVTVVNRIYKELNIKTIKKDCVEIGQLTESQIKEIIDLYVSGHSFNKIPRLLSFKSGNKTIKKVIHRNNIPVNRNYPNPMEGTHFYKKWIEKYGEEVAAKMIAESKEKLSIKYSGKNNPAYGKVSHQRSGCGWKGWYKTHYFRSLREVAYMIHLDENNINWSSAEKKCFEIKYVNWDGADRTYRPDFLINEKNLIEIKPKRLHNSPTIMAKTKAALIWAAENSFTYEIIDFKIDGAKILAALNGGLVKFDRDYKEKFLNYISSK